MAKRVFTPAKRKTRGGKSNSARVVRIQLSGEQYLHLDEVEVFGPADPIKNLALNKPANQVSVSPWSVSHRKPSPVNWRARTDETLAHCQKLAGELRNAGVNVAAETALLSRLKERFTFTPIQANDENPSALFVEARALQRKLALANPLLDFDALLFTKRVPGTFNHMSDQYYGWWSRPGGGLVE